MRPLVEFPRGLEDGVQRARRRSLFVFGPLCPPRLNVQCVDENVIEKGIGTYPACRLRSKNAHRQNHKEHCEKQEPELSLHLPPPLPMSPLRQIFPSSHRLVKVLSGYGFDHSSRHTAVCPGMSSINTSMV